MTREIKFRAWDKNGKVMVKPFTLWSLLKEFAYADGEALLENNKLLENPDWRGQRGLSSFYLGDNPHLEIMQFTGLKDRNGVEIYEEDIVQFNGRNVRVFYTPGEYWMSSVDGSKRINSSATILGNIWQDSKVIGNVHENPELLPTAN